MKLWNRASGNLKDRNSIWMASISRRSPNRNPDLEAAIIRATSHDVTYVDYRNAQRVFAWVKTSPAYLKPLIWALSKRMEKTRSWVVALKGLMLMHGVFCCKIPVMEKIGRLPFDLSNFSDGHSHLCKTWGFNSFIRSYFAFLDQRAFWLGTDTKEDEEQTQKTNESMLQELIKLQQWQTLLDMLLQIKPEAAQTNVGLILEAMDCIIIEIFDIYSRICNGVARILVKIYAAGKVEANMALKVLRKATAQGDRLSLYFELCKNLGVRNASKFSKVEKIPQEDIRELEQIINGVLEDKATVVRQNGSIEEGKGTKEGPLKTVIGKMWERFDEQLRGNKEGTGAPDGGKMTVAQNPSTATCNSRPHAYQS
ncbi:hypothetical protein PVL29_000592 [Vitis rotundifolia]|uniref:ENTH domain-containing protein n=1 Tax=Vitis rotundifolia TaxID=103349 RepID=A0AA39E4Y9_VITRO|nr:hypothetical protein PVL29_000592 [Vitis rotundifolia]